MKSGLFDDAHDVVAELVVVGLASCAASARSRPASQRLRARRPQRVGEHLLRQRTRGSARRRASSASSPPVFANVSPRGRTPLASMGWPRSSCAGRPTPVEDLEAEADGVRSTWQLWHAAPAGAALEALAVGQAQARIGPARCPSRPAADPAGRCTAGSSAPSGRAHERRVLRRRREREEAGLRGDAPARRARRVHLAQSAPDTRDAVVLGEPFIEERVRAPAPDPAPSGCAAGPPRRRAATRRASPGAAPRRRPGRAPARAARSDSRRGPATARAGLDKRTRLARLRAAAPACG